MPRPRPGTPKIKPRPNTSDAEREIRQAQAEKVARRKEADEADEELARVLRRHIGDGTPVAEIGTWLVTEKNPKGVSRQQVYNLVKEKTERAEQEKPVKKIKPRPTKRPRPRRNST